MSEELATYNISLPSPDVLAEVLGKGDLSKLTPEQRTSYLIAVCKSLGLNPLTQPFDFIVFDGKMSLYAKRGAADQLRRIYRVNLEIAEQKVDDGMFSVVVTARTPDGREDTDLGAVCLEGLKGQAKANALMKALTKAKRRVTLSICGLGFMDESEVDDIARESMTSLSIEDTPPYLLNPVPETGLPSPATLPEPKAEPTPVDPWKPRAAYYAWCADNGIATADGSFAQVFARFRFNVPSRKSLTPEGWATLHKESQGRGVEWHKAGEELWTLLQSDTFFGWRQSLMLYLPDKFKRPNLLAMDAAQFKTALTGIKRHQANDVAAWKAEVLQFHAKLWKPDDLAIQMAEALEAFTMKARAGEQFALQAVDAVVQERFGTSKTQLASPQIVELINLMEESEWLAMLHQRAEDLDVQANVNATPGTEAVEAPKVEAPKVVEIPGGTARVVDANSTQMPF